MTRAPSPHISMPSPGEADDQVLPFAIDQQDMRGRLTRLGPVLNDILKAHAYPRSVAHVLAEVLALTAVLGSMLKEEGRLTIQAKSDGAISLLVADYFDGGAMRGYAQFDPASVAKYGDAASLKALTGRGYLAITLEQGDDNESYQGIVDLDGESLSECATLYFLQSEQTPTRLRLAAQCDETGWWRAGGLLLQHLSRGEDGGPRLLSLDQQEDWNRVSTLMMSVRDDELIAPNLDSADLLYRLFHEEGVRVFEPTALEKGCRCDRARLVSVLSRFPQEDLDAMEEAGLINATCEYCNRTYSFTREELAP
ncbi:MAG: Hsp33 family molecular chaperone HslO [Pseudomonadota bacterium]